MVARSSLAGALALLICLAAAVTAGATYPGEDGAIAFAGHSFSVSPIFAPEVFGATEQGDVYDLTATCGQESLLEPDWSADGSRLAFTAFRGEPIRRIQVMPLGGVPRFVTEGADPAWSPDGERILFSREGDLWTIRPDGSDPRNLTSTADVQEEWPAWSPDANRIVFSAGPGVAPRQLYVMDADGANRVQLTKAPPYVSYAEDVAPDWSPDGRRIAFERRLFSHDSGRTSVGLYTIAPDGSGETPITYGAYGLRGSPSHPSWSPSGTRIAFSTLSDGGISTIGASGGDLRLIVRGTGGPIAGVEGQPDWGPAVPLADRACSQLFLKAASFKARAAVGDRARWSIRCRAPVPKQCRVTLRLSKSHRQLGRADARIPGGLITDVAVRAGRFGRRLLAHRGELHVRFRAVVRYALNPTRTVVSKDGGSVVLTRP